MTIVLLGITALAIGSAVIFVQMRRGRLFTLLTLYTALFILEVPGGALKALLPGIFYDYASTTSENPLPWVPKALAISIGGYLLFLYGYACAAALTRTRPAQRDERVEDYFERWWRQPYKLLLLGVTLAAIGAGFVQHWARIRAAGGFLTFLATAYRHRFGTATETAGETMVVVLANIVASAAVPLVLIWILAWLRGRLGWFEKTMVAGVLLLLFLRQWSTMFRAVLIFTLLSLVAIYAAERKVKLMRWVAIGVMLFAGLVGVNFLHYYLYYLTAGWEQQGLAESMSQLIAPHGHVYTLASIVRELDAGGYELAGRGFVESLFFFVPRAFWLTKADTLESGTLLVQGWADLPTHYQMAVTMVGEWIAHFGLLGILGMVLYGAVYGGFDSFANRGPVHQAALYGLLLSRVLADSGMALSAVSITIFCLAVYYGMIAVVHAIVWLWEQIISIPARLAGPRRQVVRDV